MTLYIVNSRHPGTLCQSEIVYEYGIANAHAIKGVSAQRRHFNARFGRINSKGGVQHGKSPAMAYCVYRHLGRFLEERFCSSGHQMMLGHQIVAGIFTVVTLNLRALHLISSYLIIVFVKNVIIRGRGTEQLHCALSRFKDLCRFTTRLTMRLILPPEFSRGVPAFLLTGLVRGT